MRGAAGVTVGHLASLPIMKSPMAKKLTAANRLVLAAALMGTAGAAAWGAE